MRHPAQKGRTMANDFEGMTKEDLRSWIAVLVAEAVDRGEGEAVAEHLQRLLDKPSHFVPNTKEYTFPAVANDSLRRVYIAQTGSSPTEED